MKKTFKVIMALTLTTMLSGCGIKFGVESRNNNWGTWIFNNDDDSNDSSYSSENVNISESIDGITSLDINIDVSNVDIEYYDGENLEISGWLSKYSRGINTKKRSEKLIINEDSKQDININSDNSSELEIKIPRNFNGDLEFNFGVAECEIHDLELNNIVINGGVGSLSLEEVSFNKLVLKSGVGEVSLETEKKTGDITVEGGMGEINIALGDINGNLKLDGGMGSTTIKIPVNAPININSDSGFGDTKISAKTASETKYNFDITVGMGSIEVTN
ncbi:DUF4097 family beta strand repeat-containing protein [Clostridium nigeriense]|uniref:DUF4097 family beta strand repeat-containing protein n=1 Tax=Clostridium nigeriense TaxID=1805470 RepID=UPI003D335690